MWLRRPSLPSVAIVAGVMLGACGGSSDDDGAGDGSQPTVPTVPTDAGDAGASPAGRVTDPQPPGQAKVVVDGREFTLTEPGAIGCSITDDSISFSFRTGDNEVTLGGGANLENVGWMGLIELVVANPDGENGPISYYPDLAASGGGVTVAGSSMSYAGAMLKQPAQDGTNPPPVEVGDGLVSVTCG